MSIDVAPGSLIVQERVVSGLRSSRDEGLRLLPDDSPAPALSVATRLGLTLDGEAYTILAPPGLIDGSIQHAGLNPTEISAMSPARRAMILEFCLGALLRAFENLVGVEVVLSSGAPSPAHSLSENVVLRQASSQKLKFETPHGVFPLVVAGPTNARLMLALRDLLNTAEPKPRAGALVTTPAAAERSAAGMIALGPILLDEAAIDILEAGDELTVAAGSPATGGLMSAVGIAPLRIEENEAVFLSAFDEEALSPPAPGRAKAWIEFATGTMTVDAVPGAKVALERHADQQAYLLLDAGRKRVARGRCDWRDGALRFTIQQKDPVA